MRKLGDIMNKELYARYTNFLLDEMIVSFGCTEPIALAYVGAVAASKLPGKVERLVVRASGNIIKNVKSVLVPNTNGCFGMEISVAMGAVIARPELKLEILESATPEDLAEAKKLVENRKIEVELAEGIPGLYIEVHAMAQGHEAVAIAQNEHTNIIYIAYDGEVSFDNPVHEERAAEIPFTFDDIYDFAQHCDLEPLREILEKEKKYNTAISNEGLSNAWGASIGRIVTSRAHEDDLYEHCVAAAAAGSDARMSGCSLPVVINSGSGNQGITASVPVITYARAIGASEEELDRALVFSNTIAEYQKQGIGRLSAYCGVVSAASAAVAAIAFLEKQPKDIIARTLVNSLATTSGMVCDGAKPSCAGKIATALRTAFIGYEQAKWETDYRAGDGLVKADVDQTIRTIGRVARYGMAQTDIRILNEMIGEK